MPEKLDAAADAETGCSDGRIHVLHGNRNSSKTTSMLQMIQRDLISTSDSTGSGRSEAADGCPAFSCTLEEAVYGDGKKIGYVHHVFGSGYTEGRRYAAVHKNRGELFGGHIRKWGRFFMSDDAFTEVRKLLLKDLEEGVRLFCIDEVGKMELSGECGHFELLKQLFRRQDTTIYITVRTQNLDEVKKCIEQYGRNFVTTSVERISDYE